MAFWRNVEFTSGVEGRIWWAAPLVLGIILVVFHYRPGDRKRVRASLSLFVASIASLLGSAAFLTFGMGHSHWCFLLLRAVSVFTLAMAIINVASVFVFGIVLRAVRMEPPEIAQDLIIVIIYAVVALTVLGQGGVDLRSILATSAVLTVVVGFSLQDSLGNIIGGTLLQAEQVIRVGDWIKVDDIEGKVKATRWRHTSIETRNWDTVIIPNSALVKARVTVVGRHSGSTPQHRQWVYFQVSLHYSPNKVIDTVEKALRAEPIPYVAATPELHCILTDIRNGDGTYAVRYWLTDMSKPDPTDSLIRTRIFTALHRAAIPLAVPSQSIVIAHEDARRDEHLTQEMERRISALREMELFQPLTDEERGEIAEKLIPAPFVKGEAITQQGAEAHWLYILTEGEADVRVSMDGVSKQVGSLKGGEYFGEMGLMTGELRTATVVARTDVKCFRLGREVFQDILERRPELAEDISATLARRRVGLEAAREQVNEEVMRERVKSTQKAFLRGIREYFGLSGAEAKRLRN